MKKNPKKSENQLPRRHAARFTHSFEGGFMQFDTNYLEMQHAARFTRSFEGLDFSPARMIGRHEKKMARRERHAI